MRDRLGLLTVFIRGFVVVAAGVTGAAAFVGSVLLLATLTGCGSMPAKPVQVETVELPVRQYVTVPKELVKRCAWPKSAPLKDVIETARKRKTCLQQYEGQLDGIERLK